jgi:hypothetical protein
MDDVHINLFKILFCKREIEETSYTKNTNNENLKNYIKNEIE